MPRDGLLFTKLIREISVGDPFGYYVGSAFMNRYPNESYNIRVANSSEEQIKLKLGLQKRKRGAERQFRT